MNSGKTLAVTLAFVLVTLSGCVGSEGEGSTASASGVSGSSEVAPPSESEAQIVGVVTDDAFTPIANAQVAILEQAAQFTTLTDEAGAFTFTGLEPGRVTVAVQKLGFESGAQTVNLEAGQRADIAFALEPIPLALEPRHFTLIGEGYFACGAYLIVVTWGNLDACVWDNHKPRYTFETDLNGFYGIMQEISWQQNTALTARELLTSLQYKPVCDPFCSNDKSWAGRNGPSPARAYIDLEGESFDEPDVVQLASMTFPGGRGPSSSGDPGSGPVIVFQQRMTHYITQWWNAHGDLEEFSALPDA